MFNKGIDQYANSAFVKAVEAFQSVATVHPEDNTAAFFLASAKHHLQHTGKEKIPGIVQMIVK